MGFLHRGNAYLTGTEKATCIRWQFLFTYRTCTCFLQMHILYPPPSFTLILIFYLYIYFFQAHPHFLKLFSINFFFCYVSFLLVFPGITFLFHQETPSPSPHSFSCFFVLCRLLFFISKP